MHRTKKILYVIGIALIIIGFFVEAYILKIDTVPRGCFENDASCNRAPDPMSVQFVIGMLILFSGVEVMIAGIICMIWGRRKTMATQ